MNNADMPILSLVDVKRSYAQADAPLDVLKGVNLTLTAGEMVALVGPSGAGKSTLLHLAGLLDKPSAGQVLIDGVDASHMTEAERTQKRGRTIGFVYQFHHLLPEFSALENIIIPQMIIGETRKAAEVRARELLVAVSLSHRIDHRPNQLSGGEQQRVAIARALANRPKLLIADEPTGNLDPETAADVFALLQSLAKAEGLAALVATHNLDLAGQMHRTVTMRGGILT